jgi:hypothetical protein
MYNNPKEIRLRHEKIRNKLQFKKIKLIRYGCLKFLNREKLHLVFEEIKNKYILNVPIRVDLSKDNVVAFKENNQNTNQPEFKRLKLDSDQN